MPGFMFATLFLFLSTATAQAPRAEALAMRVQDGSIAVDARDGDWPLSGEARAKFQIVSADEKKLNFAHEERGRFEGPDDSSVVAWMAVDSKNFYLFANVRNQSLFNDTDIGNIYDGDDFEIFIDANPLEARFAQKKNENVRQFIFLPARINVQFPKDTVWQSEQNPGVAMASRLTPWGYQIEISIPKALFPAWQANPDMASFGFDAQLIDADSPGLDGPHSAKYGRFLLSPAAHFVNSAALANVTVAPEPVPAAAATSEPAALDIETLLKRIPAATAADSTELSQSMLDRIGDDRIGEVVDLAVDSKLDTLRKTALFILAKRPELPVPPEKLLALLAPVKNLTYGETKGADFVCYDMVALARRGKLPSDDAWFGFYSRQASPQVVLAYCWALGVNGDRKAVPLLSNMLFDSNIRIRVKAALALGALKDPQAIPALTEMTANDPHNYGRKAAQEAINQINGKIRYGRQKDSPLLTPVSHPSQPLLDCIWHALVPIDCMWAHGCGFTDGQKSPYAITLPATGKMESPLYQTSDLKVLVQDFKTVGGGVTFNVGIFQEGGLGEETVTQLADLASRLA